MFTLSNNSQYDLCLWKAKEGLYLKGAPLGQAPLALLANIRLSWTELLGTNALAYLSKASVTKKLLMLNMQKFLHSLVMLWLRVFLFVACTINIVRL